MSDYEYISKMWIEFVRRGHFDCLFFAAKNFDELEIAHEYYNGGYTPKQAVQDWIDRI